MPPLRLAGFADAGAVRQHHQRQQPGNGVLLEGRAQGLEQAFGIDGVQTSRTRRQLAGPEVTPAHRGEWVDRDPALLLGQRQRLLQPLQGLVHGVR
ncbi:hypothetical protein D9M68_916410 [compost metagenome]